MTNAVRLLGVALIGIVVSLAASGSDARVRHHHRHVAAPAASRIICGRHHRHCHAAPAQAAATRMVCRRHHRHCHAVAAPARSGRVVCGRHHRHCRVVAAPSRRARTAAAAPAGEGAGTCRSVRLHGQWVQQCNFQGQGQPAQ